MREAAVSIVGLNPRLRTISFIIIDTKPPYLQELALKHLSNYITNILEVCLLRPNQYPTSLAKLIYNQTFITNPIT